MNQSRYNLPAFLGDIGEPGRPGNIEVRLPGDETWSEARQVSMLKLPKGSMLRIRAASGGGWEPPEHRIEAAKLEDTLSGLVVDSAAQRISWPRCWVPNFPTQWVRQFIDAY